MSRDKRYQRLLNSPKWWEVKRIVWQRAGGLCEECQRNGRITAGVDCHHLQPVETARTLQEMERLCYNADNVRLLCIPHHIEAHKAMHSHDKTTVIERRKLRQARWVEQMKAKFLNTKDKDTGTMEAD